MSYKSDDAANILALRQGENAALQGLAYDTCPHPEGHPLRLSWCEGHNAQRAANLLRDSVEVLSQIDQGGSEGKVFARDNCIERLRKSVAAMKGGGA